MFASDSRRTVPVPFAAPHTVTIQKLSGREVERAQAEHLAAFQGNRSPRGWAAIFQRALENGAATDKDAQRALVDPLNGYDRFAVVRAGLKGWSFTVTDYKGTEQPKALTPEAIGDLDDEALEFIAVEVMRLTKPGLFLTVEEREAAQKNG